MPPRADADAAFDALLAFVKKRPDASFKDAAEIVAAAGHRVFPIQFSRAKARLAKPARSGKRAKKTPAAPAKSPRRAAKAIRLVVRTRAELATWSEIVARINAGAGGARAELQGNGEHWTLIVR